MVQNYSTRKLKRLYWQQLRLAWRLEPHKLEGFSRDIGLSKDYWQAHRFAAGAKEELKRRGVWMP